MKPSNKTRMVVSTSHGATVLTLTHRHLIIDKKLSQADIKGLVRVLAPLIK